MRLNGYIEAQAGSKASVLVSFSGVFFHLLRQRFWTSVVGQVAMLAGWPTRATTFT